jgi:hypothetical protein
MNAQHESLTPAEQRFLEHQKEAERHGLALPDYYRSKGLSLNCLYDARKSLIRKGVLPRARQGRKPAAKKPPSQEPFVPVRVAAARQESLGKSCRLRSPSGWVLECDGLPDLSWVSALMGVQS